MRTQQVFCHHFPINYSFLDLHQMMKQMVVSEAMNKSRFPVHTMFRERLGAVFYIPPKLIGRIPLYLHWRKSTKILQKCRKGQLFLVMIGLKGLFLSDCCRFLFLWRNVKIFLNFGALRIAQKSPNARWQANMRVLSHYPQVADNETFERMLPLPDFF